MTTVSLYARVSSEIQAKKDTIASQIEAIENRISLDGYLLLDEFRFIDNGYSGSHLIRPALERLRDEVFEGKIDKIYIHSPDRLARKYAYQILLSEEFQKSGAEIIFLNHQGNESPESHLLLQVQGMIAEYERAKITERHRRGRIYAARQGSINVLAKAPYGYRYIDKYTGSGKACFQINIEEMETVKKIFYWIGIEKLSITEVCRQLKKLNIVSSTGNFFVRSSVYGMLKNPAYKGEAAFGKTKTSVRVPRPIPKRNANEHPKNNYSVRMTKKEDWIYIPVPPIIEGELFDVVQEQLQENRKTARLRVHTIPYLLQGLLICKRCRYAYCGKFYRGKPRKDPHKTSYNSYCYYRCTGTDSNRFMNGTPLCDNRPIRMDVLDIAVWEEVKYLLKNPQRIAEEHQRRLLNLEKLSLDKTSNVVEKQVTKLNQGIARLIDSYADGAIEKEEFEPRIKIMKQNLKVIEDEKKKTNNQKNMKNELTILITQLEDFSENIKSKLDTADFDTKRNMMRMLIKRVEINLEEVNVIFRVQNIPSSVCDQKTQAGSILPYCPRSIDK